MEVKMQFDFKRQTESKRNIDANIKDPQANKHDRYEKRLSFPLRLIHTWTWWYHEPDNGQNEQWVYRLHNISCITFAQDYWRLCNNLKSPSELPIGADYYILKSGISPIWKTAANKRGSQALLTLRREEPNGSRTVDTCWQQYSIAVLAGQFGNHCASVNGTFVRVRATLFEVGFWMHSEATPQERDIIREAASALSESVGRVKCLPHNTDITLL
ncbi:hypothetical protein M514_07833 [Trichuris suis]|uniref:Uncharacterized protein n=1 Tax=Trichuris suis TaxID=68888 RepID=A0A085N5D4_9BILA|nr:hypothetical protein M513_07833 [Trichuris suis]KFD64680.1 hypothetical protein M514_07833 [Trichuris suis]KHJ42535.1 eukaryotic initiation factor 4E [Trichuris suis]